MPLEYQLAHRFDELCRHLKDSVVAQPGALPLAYWALPTDRRLPKALLGLSLRDIVGTPFAKLRATPGIGAKKLATLIELLERAVSTIDSEPPRAAPPALSRLPTKLVS